MKQLSKETLALLEDIERRIDPEVEEDYAAQWETFLSGRFTGEIFTPRRKAVTQPGVTLPDLHINDAIEDLDTMLIHGLRDISWQLSSETQNLCIRANYGTGILPSLFGAELFVMLRELSTLPTTRPFNDTEKMRVLPDKGMPALTNGLGQRVFDFGELCAEVFSRYPKIQKYVQIYHPDTQGPLDVCELLWGGEMFYAMYDEPELVHSILRLLTDTYAAFLDKWFALCPSYGETNVHWAHIRHRGRIMLRDDSAMNLSPDLYREYALPYDSEMLERFGGGVVHFCGRGDHYMEDLCRCPFLTGINLSQPEYNNMELIYQNTIDKGIPLLGFPYAEAERAAARPGGTRHLVHR